MEDNEASDPNPTKHLSRKQSHFLHSISSDRTDSHLG